MPLTAHKYTCGTNLSFRVRKRQWKFMSFDHPCLFLRHTWWCSRAPSCWTYCSAGPSGRWGPSGTCGSPRALALKHMPQPLEPAWSLIIISSGKAWENVANRICCYRTKTQVVDSIHCYCSTRYFCFSFGPCPVMLRWNSWECSGICAEPGVCTRQVPYLLHCSLAPIFFFAFLVCVTPRLLQEPSRQA